jgi:SAM-dependent methyltransferase
MSEAAEPVQRQDEAKSFRFYDNREKYLLFVTTCSEKSAIAERVGLELPDIVPRRPALRVFDAGMGDGSVLAQVMQNMHKRFRHIPWVVVGKEISMEDVRLSLAKLPDRLHEHPETVAVITNMNYTEAPRLTPSAPEAAAAMRWWEVALEGDTSYDFQSQIRDLREILAEGWQIRVSEKTGNPLYKHPAVLVIYRRDREFVLGPIVPKRGDPVGLYDLVIASQPYRARQPAPAKVRNVIAPLARALAPGGRLVALQSSGGDPGMEIVHRLWPDEQPFRTPRRDLLREAALQLDQPSERDLVFIPYDNERSLFRYHLHTLPTEVERSIGLSTTLAAWNAAVYVAQITEDQVIAAYDSGIYRGVTQDVLRRHGGLWFNDESFVIARRPAS